MKIALLDFHKKKNNKITETYKIRDALKVKDSIEVEIFEMLEGITPQVPLEQYSALILSGSDSNYLIRYRGYYVTKKLIKQAAADDMPILGICAGHQILASMLGISLELMKDGPEMGWYEIFLSPEGKNDPLFKGFPDRFVSFFCHIKKVDLENKNGVAVLAKNDNCVQALKFEKNCYSIQFHPEDTIEGGEELIQKYKRRPPTKQNRVSTPAELFCKQVFANFIEMVESYEEQRKRLQ